MYMFNVECRIAILMNLLMVLKLGHCGFFKLEYFKFYVSCVYDHELAVISSLS